MTPKECSIALRKVEKRYKNEITPTFEVRISDMASTAADAIDELLGLIDQENNRLDIIELHDGQKVRVRVREEEFCILVKDITFNNNLLYKQPDFSGNGKIYKILLGGDMI